MKFNWDGFTEFSFDRYIKNSYLYDDYIGVVHVGDICIELMIHDDDILSFEFYVAHEDTGYGYKNDVLPYDYANGFDIDMPCDLSYEEFKDKAEKLFMEYIESYNGNYSLVEHANRPLEIW